MREIFKFKEFMKLFTANLISRFGDSIDMIAYSYMVYKLTGSKMLLATIFIFNVLPNLLFSSFAGTVVDFFSKKKIIILGDILRGSLALFTAYLYSQNLLAPWHLFIFTFTNSTIESFVSPCKFATIPKLIDEKYYLTANSSLQSLTKFVELIGMAAAGIIIGFIGISGAMLINASTFLLSGLIISFAKFPKEELKQLTKRTYMNSYKEGMKFIFNRKIILAFIISMSLMNFLLTPLNAFQPAYVEDILKMGPQGISYISLAFSIGNIFGGILAGKLGNKLGIKKMIFGGFFFTGVFYAGLSSPAFISLFSPIILACFSMAMIGMVFPFASAGLITFLMTITPKEMLARVGSVINMLGQSATPLGAFVSGIVVSIIGLEYLILLFGIIFILTSLLPTIALSKYEKTSSQSSESTELAQA